MQLNTNEWLTLIIALYGALISTILGVREIRKERRKISVYFVYEVWSNLYSITITNIGHRPITLIDLYLKLPDGREVPTNVIMNGHKGEEQGWNFPVTLSDGEQIAIRIPTLVSKEIGELKGKVAIKVYDAEGNNYNKYKRIERDAKSGKYSMK